jgi:hypothetical protein
MNLRQICDEVWHGLPVRLQPNKANTDPAVINLARMGWTADEILGEILKGNPQGPGIIVNRLRGFAGEPPPSQWQRTPITKRTSEGFTPHQPCTDATHEAGCELCYCNSCKPRCTLPHQHTYQPQHHLPVPMPDWFRDKYADALGRFGYINAD